MFFHPEDCRAISASSPKLFERCFIVSLLATSTPLTLENWRSSWKKKSALTHGIKTEKKKCSC
jgi:hypothetical protein